MAAERFDLAVIGAGPAGAACALVASRLGRSVAILDPADGGGDKPCGEGIMPSGADVLLDLGLEDLVARGRPFAGLRHRVDGARPLEVDLPRPGVAVRRTDLAAALGAALAAAPGVRRVRSAATATPAGEGFEIDAGPAGRLLARTLVAADGAGGRAAPWLLRAGERRRPGTRFGLRARFAESALLDRVEVHMGRGCEVYLTPLPGGVLNAAVLFDRAPAGVAGPAALLAWALDRHPAAATHLGATVTRPEGRPLARVRPRVVSERGAFLAGDAGGSVDPIVGCGVTIALRTGAAAARAAAAVVAGGDPRAVDRRYASEFRRECLARHALATFLRHGDGHPRLARAVASLLGRMPRATRSLARIAGGR